SYEEFLVTTNISMYNTLCSYEEDLRAMRFLSVNSIIDPWVFAILRPPVLRLIRSVICCRTPCKVRTKTKQASCVAKPDPVMEVDICHP
uniref:G-protein coupled receptors family 1 profile domain-containing protein n=1 Tax=Anolis carolinensis TaxID=28377 RepID=A0A803SMT5_ANOCA